MSKPVQSSNLGRLFTELGFDGTYPGREKEVINEEFDNFPIDDLFNATPIAYFKADSEEARSQALEFCVKDQRGKTLWPENSHKGWPTWSQDRSKILRLVAHILSLKALYKYQRQSKNKGKTPSPSKKMSKAGTIQTTERELSPESMKLVGPPPPRGTKRRPPKSGVETTSQETSKAFMPSMIAPDPNTTQPIPDSQLLRKIFKHMSRLSPTNISEEAQSFAQEFTRAWLQTPKAPFPEAATNRILTFMHEKGLYDSEAKEMKLQHLITQLRKGTDMESLDSGIEYNVLEDRILAKIRELSKMLYRSGLVKYTGSGKYRRTERFDDIWKNKESHWNQQTSHEKAGDTRDKTIDRTAQETTQEGNGELDNLYDDDSLIEVFMPPKRTTNRIVAKTPISASILSSTEKVVVDPTISPSEALRSPNANKRQKITSAEEPVAALSVASTPEPINELAASLLEDNTTEESAFALAREAATLERPFPTSPSPSDRGAPSHPATPPARRVEVIPITPPSPLDRVRSVETFANHPTSELAGGPSTPVSNRSPRSRLLPPMSASTSNPEIFLTLPGKQYLRYDMSSRFPGSKLRTSSLADFFEVVAQNSGVACELITCITFSFLFTLGVPQLGEMGLIINRSAREEEWEDIKDSIKRVYRITRLKNPREKTFEILVDIGDTRPGVIEIEDDGGM